MKPLSQREERNDETVNVQTTRFYMSLVSPGDPEKRLFTYYLVVKSTVRSTGTHTAVGVFHRQKAPTLECLCPTPTLSCGYFSHSRKHLESQVLALHSGICKEQPAGLEPTNTSAGSQISDDFTLVSNHGGHSGPLARGWV